MNNSVDHACLKLKTICNWVVRMARRTVLIAAETADYKATVGP